VIKKSCKDIPAATICIEARPKATPIRVRNTATSIEVYAIVTVGIDSRSSRAVGDWLHPDENITYPFCHLFSVMLQTIKPIRKPRRDEIVTQPTGQCMQSPLTVRLVIDAFDYVNLSLITILALVLTNVSF